MNVPPAVKVMRVVLTVVVTASTVSCDTVATVLRNKKVSALQRNAKTAHTMIPGRYSRMAAIAGHGTAAATFHRPLPQQHISTHTVGEEAKISRKPKDGSKDHL
jgi:hypothetical protein